MHNYDPIWMRTLLALHIAAGTAAFLLAPVALATAKGGKTHKQWGMVYLWAMGLVTATAIPMAFYRPVLFLTLVAVFSFYSAWAGYRVLRLKSLAKGGSAEPIDWIAGMVTFFSSGMLAILGTFRPAAVQGIGVVSIAFGFIGMWLAAAQMISFVKKPKEKMFWWYTHLGYMIGSYIAAWSAFSSVTLTRSLGNVWYVWLWPTIVGVPAIILMIGYYKRKFASRMKMAY